MILYQLDTGGRPEKIDRAALIEADGWALQPLLCFRLRSEDIRCFCEDLGELPGTATLFLAEGLGRRVLATLPGAQAHTDRPFKRLVLADDDEATDKMFERQRGQAV